METTELGKSATRAERSRPGGLVLTALTLGFAVVQLDVSVVNVAVKAIGTGLGAAGCWLTARYAAETPRARDRGVDLPGQAAVMVALAALAGATIWAGSRGFGAPRS